MRKSLYFSAAFAAILATSCSDDMVQNATNDGEGNVLIQLQLPNNFATRAFGNGLTSTRLQYAVYHTGESNPIISDEATFDGLNATVSLNLVNGQTYDFVFWADAPENDFYTFDPTTQSVSISYEDASINDESRDAFFGQLTAQTISGPANLSATLKRPFAQINLGTSDFNLPSVGAAYPDFKSSLAVTTNVANTLNLLDGKVSGTESNVNFSADARPEGEDFPVENHTYLSMNYLLVGAEKDVVDLSFDFNNGDSNISNLTLSSVPVQRNYRTNIYGAVLTSPTDINVTIEPAFDGENNVDKAVEDFKNALMDPETEEIIVRESLDLSSLESDEMTITSDKVINFVNSGATRANDITIYVDPQKPFDIQASLTINGGTFTNGQEDFGVGIPVSMFHVRKDGELNLNGVTINGNTKHHYHGTTATGLNSALIDYWDNAVINITDSHIVGGMYVLCGMGGTKDAKVTCTNSYFESTSSNKDNGSNWAYAIRARGNVTFKDCTVVGVQGGVSPDADGTIVTFENGTYYTRNSINTTTGKPNTDGFYAVYATNGATAIINGGYFFGANMHSTLAGQGGTSCVVSGDNDTNKPVGSIIINGGYFSGIPYNHTTKVQYFPADGLQFKENEETIDGRKYLWTVVTID